MGHEGVLVTLINIRHDIADVRADLKASEQKNADKIRDIESKAETRAEQVRTEIARSREFESKTAGQFGVLKGVGGSFGAIIMAVLGWGVSQVWSHSVALESLPDFKTRVTEVQSEQTDLGKIEVSNSSRIDKLEEQVARHK